LAGHFRYPLIENLMKSLVSIAFVFFAIAGCSKDPSAASSVSSGASPGAVPSASSAFGASVRRDLVPLMRSCNWDEIHGFAQCPAFDAFGKKHEGDVAREKLFAACLGLVTDAEVHYAATTCARLYARKDRRDDLISALESAKDPIVRIELARSLAAVRASEGKPAERVIRIVRGVQSADRILQPLLASLRPDDESKEVAPEAFALAKELMLAPAVPPHTMAASLLEAAPSRRAETCTILGAKVEANVADVFWEGDWIFPRLTQYEECDREVARLFPVLLASIKAFSGAERPSWAMRNGLGFVGTLEDTKPLASSQRVAVAAALLDVAKGKGSDRTKADASHIRERYLAPPPGPTK